MSRIGAGLHLAVALWMCIAMGGFTPLHGQRDATVGWIISAVHPDPTPAMGAPEAEYVALNLQGDEGDSCRSAQGLQLKWNGHNRTLASDPCWPVGTTLVVHRSADSLAFVGVPFPKLGLDPERPRRMAACGRQGQSGEAQRFGCAPLQSRPDVGRCGTGRVAQCALGVR